MIKSFKQWLNEGKNVHQLHIEQLSFSGVKELRRAINILQDLRDQMYQSKGSEKNHNVSMKWDGAPAVFFGINPENGETSRASELRNGFRKKNTDDNVIPEGHSVTTSIREL